MFGLAHVCVAARDKKRQVCELQKVVSTCGADEIRNSDAAPYHSVSWIIPLIMSVGNARTELTIRQLVGLITRRLHAARKSCPRYKKVYENRTRAYDPGVVGSSPITAKFLSPAAVFAYCCDESLPMWQLW
jgi:hypothetical protein